MKRTFRVFCIAISFALVVNLVGVPAMPAHAASFVVTTNADSGTGSLRQAILDANANGAGADTITFAADYTITLASQLPTVTTEIIINGNGAANTIIQANAAPNTATYRVFQVNSEGYLTLDGLTVRNGSSGYGGGVYNAGALTVSNVTFSANSASGSIGGGMYNDSGSSATLTNVTFSANSADYGSGMFNGGSSATLTNVTFSANSALHNGGGMYNYTSSPTLTNVTFSGNSASGGAGGGLVNNQSSSVTLTNVTFSANSATYGGGGMSNDYSSSLTLTNTIIADSSSGGDCVNLNTSTVNAQNSLIEDGLTCVNGTNTNNLTGDPMLNPTLADNGGSTQTHALLADSPAINAGTNTGCPATDQRGVTRPQGLFCDIGAFELGIYTIDITSAHGTVTKNPDLPAYHEGDVVQLTAAPAADWSFDSWSGDAAGTANPVLVTMNGDKTITANYTQNEYSLTITSTHGTVVKSPNQVTYHEGDVVQLTATPNAGWSFANWTGDLTGSVNPDSVTIHGNTSVTANYTQNEYTLTITSANGTVVKNPNQATYHEGDAVQLTATPNTGWSFANWTGALTGTANPGTVIIHGNTSVTANYTLNNQAPTDLALSNNTVEENLPVGTMVGTLSTIDPDAGDTHTYSFCGGTDDTSFAIAGDALNTAAIFDFETKNSYNVCIRTDDGNDGIFDKAFAIIITDVSDNPIYNIFLPLILR